MNPTNWPAASKTITALVELLAAAVVFSVLFHFWPRTIEDLLSHSGPLLILVVGLPFCPVGICIWFFLGIICLPASPVLLITLAVEKKFFPVSLLVYFLGLGILIATLFVSQEFGWVSPSYAVYFMLLAATLCTIECQWRRSLKETAWFWGRVWARAALCYLMIAALEVGKTV